MTRYLKWDETTITDFSGTNINALYSQGYVFTRIGKGVMQETRSVRVDLSKFELSSENRRILRKTEDVRLKTENLPYEKYDWTIGKMAKDFYSEKFGDGTFSANKVKELLTDTEKSNFNVLLTYSMNNGTIEQWNNQIGYAICHETNELLHYCYPFYELSLITDHLSPIKDLGLGMMLRAIIWAKENGKKYAYLGSAQRPSDTYKMQFKGVEWWDGDDWKSDEEELKKALTQ